MRGLGLGRSDERLRGLEGLVRGSVSSASRSSRTSALRAGVTVLAYTALAAVSLVVAALREESPFITTPLLPVSAPLLVLASLALGGLVALVTVGGTRLAVKRFTWAKELHETLRPAVRDLSTLRLVAMAVASGLGEELFFRGLLVPAVGLVVSSLLFGLLHQAPGRARFVWMAWASIMGLVFALVFRATGSLVGPLFAHVTINAMNLVFLRDTTAIVKPRHLGGLLRV